MRGFTVFLAAACALQPALSVAQETTGTLIGAVRDARGAPLAGATVRVRSKALIGGEQRVADHRWPWERRSRR